MAFYEKTNDNKTVIHRSIYSPAYESARIPAGKPGNQKPLLDRLNLMLLRNPHRTTSDASRDFVKRVEEKMRAEHRKPSSSPAFLGRVDWAHA